MSVYRTGAINVGDAGSTRHGSEVDSPTTSWLTELVGPPSLTGPGRHPAIDAEVVATIRRSDAYRRGVDRAVAMPTAGDQLDGQDDGHDDDRVSVPVPAEPVPMASSRSLPACRYCAQGDPRRPASWSQRPHREGECLSAEQRTHNELVRQQFGLTPAVGVAS